MFSSTVPSLINWMPSEEKSVWPLVEKAKNMFVSTMGFDEADAIELSRKCVYTQFQDMTCLIQKGQKASHVHIVVSGSVLVSEDRGHPGHVNMYVRWPLK